MSDEDEIAQLKKRVEALEKTNARLIKTVLDLSQRDMEVLHAAFATMDEEFDDAREILESLRASGLEIIHSFPDEQSNDK